MLQLKNSTPFQASIALFPDPDGIDTLYVVMKATFDLGPKMQLADEQVPICMADEYYDDPETSSMKYASEMHLMKPGTDVVLVGNAWAPRSKGVEQLDVTLTVANRTKTVRVFGDREWSGGLLGVSISPPEPFESMPLVYERAFGGVHQVDPDKPEILAEERNPIGVGFRGKRKPKEMAGTPLPNLEDPAQPIKKPGDLVAPAGFGFVSPSWLPRRIFAGTYDEAWQKKRAPILPEDFDSRFFNAAHPDLVFDRYLEGGEPVQVKNACSDGPLKFRIPRCEIDLEATIAGRIEPLDSNLETVLIEPDEGRLCLTWRAALPCDKQALKVEEIRVQSREFAISE